MAMNHMRKKSAIATFSPMIQAGTISPEEIKTAIEADPKGYKEDEVIEILDALYPAPTPNPEIESGDKVRNEPPSGNKPAATDTPADRSGTLKPYYKYKVKPKYQKIRLKNREQEEVLMGYDREGDVLQITNLEERHVKQLNAQTPNSMIYYFEDKDTTFIDIEKWD